MMKFIAVIFIFWMAMRIARYVASVVLAGKPADPKVKSGTSPASGDALELVACPYCGVYTTAPCTNPNCPGA